MSVGRVRRIRLAFLAVTHPSHELGEPEVEQLCAEVLCVPTPSVDEKSTRTRLAGVRASQNPGRHRAVTYAAARLMPSLGVRHRLDSLLYFMQHRQGAAFRAAGCNL